MKQISVRELSERMKRGDRLLLLDVREPYECEICSIGGLNIPLSILPLRLGELDSGAEIVVYCHHGSRSMRAAGFLAAAGFRSVLNLSGGIDAWSVQVDPSVPRY